MSLCLDEPDVKARKNCISTLSECASICREASSFMLMDAKHAADLCKLCERFCNECATECDMLKDEHCKKCAAECRACAAECKAMAGANLLIIENPRGL